MSPDDESKEGAFKPFAPGHWPWAGWWNEARSPMSFVLAPQQLAQPINSGWSFGNVVVNNGNSSAPQIEQDVLRQHSYGRQIGRLLDVVELLVKALPAAKTPDSRVTEFLALADEVKRIKQASSASRLAHLRAELEALKAADPSGWAAIVKP